MRTSLGIYLEISVCTLIQIEREKKRERGKTQDHTDKHNDIQSGYLLYTHNLDIQAGLYL